MKLSEIGEFGLIESIKKDYACDFQGLIKGIGDDCAVFTPTPGRVLLFTTDTLVEDIHFLKGSITLYQLGLKAVAVNLSDIAAMGGRPLVLLISLGIPPSMAVDEAHEIYRGMKVLCERHQVSIGGGDTVAVPDKLILTVSLIGDAKESEVLYRSGARPGDRVYLTGTIGDSSMGLRILRNEISAAESLHGHFIKAHNEPDPLIETGRVIAASRLASAMIDVSDGLLSDLGHICEESGVGAVLFRDEIPLSPELQSFAGHARLNPFDLALAGGEDYVLLVTVPEANSNKFERLCKDKSPSPLHRIGEIKEKGGLTMVNDDGSEMELAPKGYDHFIS